MGPAELPVPADADPGRRAATPTPGAADRDAQSERDPHARAHPDADVRADEHGYADRDARRPARRSITLRVLSHQWDWCAVDIPCQQGSCPYEIGPKDPAGLGQNGITLHEGCSYKLIMYNADSPSGDGHPHEMNGNLVSIGIPDTILVPGAQTDPIDVTIPASGPADLSFNCLNTSCGNSQQHEGMTGVIHIAP